MIDCSGQSGTETFLVSAQPIVESGEVIGVIATIRTAEKPDRLRTGAAPSSKTCFIASITAVRFQLLLDDRHLHVHRDCDPDLRLHRVHRSVVERFDPQMLFDPPEKQLHLPAIFVQPGNGFCRDGEVVRQGREDLAGFAVAV